MLSETCNRLAEIPCKTSQDLPIKRQRANRIGPPSECYGKIRDYMYLAQSVLRISPLSRNAVWNASDALSEWGV